MATMKAARWHAAKDVRIQEVEVPEALPHQVNVAVKFTGICGTDLHEYLEGSIFIPTEEHVYSGQKASVTLGHEFSGQIVEVGSEVTRVKVGDRVAVEPILAKNNLVGNYNLNPNLNFVGLAADGGFAKYCVLDGDLVHVIPDGLSYEQAALTEPAAVAVYAVRQSALKTGDTAAVFGLGPIGLLIVDALRAAGASKIYAVEAIHRLTNGGVDVSYEVTGVPVVLGQALAAVHKAVNVWLSQSGNEKQVSILMNLLSKKNHLKVLQRIVISSLKYQN